MKILKIYNLSNLEVILLILLFQCGSICKESTCSSLLQDYRGYTKKVNPNL